MIGSVMLVFDSRAWAAAGYDQPDGNEQFFKPAAIISTSGHGSDRVATIRWLETGELSGGHFIDAMKPLPAEEVRNATHR